MEPKDKPRRRVGSLTLGFCLILAGAALLLYYFWPGFNFILAAKLAPLVLVALGAEVLLSAVRPEARRYDFLSVFLCLFLLASTFLVAAIPTVWEYLGPQHQDLEHSLSAELESDYYARLKSSDVQDLSVQLSLPYGSKPASLKELTHSDRVWVNVSLTGPYADPEPFAQSCRQVLVELLAEGVSLDSVEFVAPALADSQQAGADHHSQEEEEDEQEPRLYSLSLYGPYQMDGSVEELCREVCLD